MTANAYGVRGVVLSGVALLMVFVVARWFPAVGVLTFIVLQVSSLACGVVASVKGSKWWWLVPAWSICYLVILSLSIYAE